MKKNLLIAAILMLLTTSSLLATDTVVTNTQSAAKQLCAVQPKAPNSNSNIYNISRGFVNLTTCWLEIFRCMVYRNSEVPFWGFVAGTIEGTGLTGMRAFGGFTDVIFLGFDIGRIYNDKFQDFVWNSQWLPNADLSSQNAHTSLHI